MQIPQAVSFLLNQLTQAGYSAWAVGGCVRDALLGRTPHDWDICTSALPEEIREVFSACHLVETGLKHGTLTVVLNHVPYEITTYRLDGTYTDHRHPDSVRFISDVREDLSRRDFTINAMACDRDGQVLDLFEGRQDLEGRLIRCVGDPARRFGEDALRVLRALRFASVLDFQIEPETDRAIRQCYPTLARVASERIREELIRLLCGPGFARILREYTEVLSFLLPDLAPCVGYAQDNPHHLYTVWEHTVRAMEGVPPEPVYRLTMLFHDTGKPRSRTTDAKGVGHYAGHPRISAEIARSALLGLHCDRALTDRVCRLTEAHDIPLDPSRRTLLRRLNVYGEEDLRALFIIHRADRIATGTRNPQHADERFRELNTALDLLLAGQPCYRLKDLAVGGKDLLALGFRGPRVGALLQTLLNRVIDGELPNERDALLASLPDPLLPPVPAAAK